MTSTKRPAVKASARSNKYPRKCECGGKMVYVHEFGQVFSHCLSCTPVSKVKIKQ